MCLSRFRSPRRHWMIAPRERSTTQACFRECRCCRDIFSKFIYSQSEPLYKIFSRSRPSTKATDNVGVATSVTFHWQLEETWRLWCRFGLDSRLWCQLSVDSPEIGGLRGFQQRQLFICRVASGLGHLTVLFVAWPLSCINNASPCIDNALQSFIKIFFKATHNSIYDLVVHPPASILHTFTCWKKTIMCC